MKEVHHPRKLWEEPARVSHVIPVKDLVSEVKRIKKEREGKPRKPFTPYVRYVPEVDCFQIYWEDAPHYCSSDPEIKDFELLRAFYDDRVVGLNLFGGKRLMGLVEVKEVGT